MPYFINCPRCNQDNRYSKIGSNCHQCSGTGRDWRDDKELESFHSWASLNLGKLKESSVVKIAHGGDHYFFTYRDTIPEHSVKKEIAEIREELEGRGELVKESAPSQIFCTHAWQADEADSSVESCLKCGKTRKVRRGSENPNEGFSYNKDLHDKNYYFPNRCYACSHYSDSRGEPNSGKDLIFCNIGGEVPADTGCVEFRPDNTAGCHSCWNLVSALDGNKRSLTCDVLGKLSFLKSEGCCSHVRKERTDVEIPYADNAIKLSKACLGTEVPNDPQLRKCIRDAMSQSGIQMPTAEEFSYDKRCATCTHEHRYHQDFGRCDYNSIPLLSYTGSNPYGYDEMICHGYSRSPSLPTVAFPKVYVDPLKDSLVRLCDGYQLRLGNMFCEIQKENTGSVLIRYSYTRRSPVYIQYNEDESCFDLHFYEEPRLEKMSLNNIEKKVQEEKGMNWVDLDDETKFFEAIGKVKVKQLENGVFSGNKFECCENCDFVTQNSSYPDGSPTGLICQKKDIFVTANGCCDLFDR